MRFEKGLALLVTVAAALAAAESLPGHCSSPKTVGPCRAAFHRWWYNATSQVCQEFIFGGCRGNSNNFLSEQDCLQTCVPVAATESGHRQELDEDRPGFGEFCAAPRVVGPCRASFPRWYFDMSTGTCQMFIYGGCRGNKNNYLFEEHCWSQCAGHRERPEAAEGPDTHPPLPSQPLGFPSRAVVLAALLAIVAALLLGSMAAFFVKTCRKNQAASGGSIWSTLDDKEHLMSSSYSL